MPLSNNRKVNIDRNWIKKELRRNSQLALSVLLFCWGIAFFLIFYLNYSFIGFLVLLFDWTISAFLFFKLPSAFEKDDKAEYVIDDIESLKNIYEMDKKSYQVFKKISIGLLIVLIVIIPIIACILYFISNNIITLDLSLGSSMLLTGILLFIWIRKNGRIELYRKIIIQ